MEEYNYNAYLTKAFETLEPVTWHTNIESEFDNIVEKELLPVLHKSIIALCRNTQDLSRDAREKFISDKIEKTKKSAASFIDCQVKAYSEFYENKSV